MANSKTLPDVPTKRVFLHAGHSKTGSSYIQALLARNAAILRERGLHYPRGGNFRAAENLEISAGNFRFCDIQANPERFDAMISHGGDVVLSSEYLFHEIAAGEAPLRFFAERGFAVNVLVFTRNPVSHILSGYSQAVKREGFQGTVDAFISSRKNRIQHPFELAHLIQHCDNVGARLIIQNYDDARSRIGEILLNFLEIDAEGIELPDLIVNRSLSSSEIEMVRVICAVFGRATAQGVSDKLCNSLPHIKSEIVYPSPKKMSQFIENVRPAVEKVQNTWHGRFSMYDIDFEVEFETAKQRHVPQSSSLSAEQAAIVRDQVIAELAPSTFVKRKMGSYIRRFRNRIGR